MNITKTTAQNLICFYVNHVRTLCSSVQNRCRMVRCKQHGYTVLVQSFVTCKAVNSSKFWYMVALPSLPICIPTLFLPQQQNFIGKSIMSRSSFSYWKVPGGPVLGYPSSETIILCERIVYNFMPLKKT